MQQRVGYHAAKFCQEAGALIVGIAEYDGAIHRPEGLDVETVAAHRRERGSILGVPGAKELQPSAEALELDCDVLIPAALERQITSANAPRIRAKVVAEGANGPTTAEAAAILRERGVLVVPDVYLNAGGVTVSYFEWLKNLSHVRFGRMGRRYEESAFVRMLRAVETATGRTFSDAERQAIAHGADESDLVNSGLEDTMVNAYHELRETWKRDPRVPDLRTAAFLAAVTKVATSYLELGIFP